MTRRREVTAGEGGCLVVGIVWLLSLVLTLAFWAAVLYGAIWILKDTGVLGAPAVLGLGVLAAGVWEEL